jgi:uncharacterized repeat protein (TIGR02543 family)
MSYLESPRTERSLLARLGVATLGLAVGAGGLSLVSPAYAATIDGLTGSGTTADPIVIDSAADLDAAAAHVNGDHATYGALAYRLGADIDYAGGTFATFQRFSGTFDGNAHEIRNVSYGSWVDGDTERIAFFGRLDGATVVGLTLTGVSAVKAGTTLPAGATTAVTSGLTTQATSATIDGVTVLDATVRNDSPANNPFDAGFVSRVAGTAEAPGVITNSMLGGDVTVSSAGKYVSAFVGYQAAYTTVSDNLVAADPDAGYMSRSAAGGANMNAAALVNYGGAGMTDQEIAGNVVLSGSVYSHATGTNGNTVSWIAGFNHAEIDSYGTNLVNADHNRTGFPAVAETAPEGHPLRWTRRAGTAYAHDVAGKWVLGNDGTATSPAELAQQETYEGLGWDFALGTGDWRWADDLGHPVPAQADLDGHDEISYVLNGGTNGANPVAYTAASAAITLAAPSRAGYTFTGWTGTGLTEPTTDVTVPAGSSGDREYVANWAAVSYALDVDLAGGSVTDPAPSTYTVESDDIGLPTPTRPGHAFAGWTGTGLDEPAATVTIAAGSTGDRSYTATWSAGDAITYDLAGGTATGANPETYLPGDADIVLANPTRDGYTFAGWTGTDLDGPSLTVTIPTGSTGARSYTATWTLDPAAIAGVSGDGTPTSPYLVGTAADLDAVAAAVNADNATYGLRHIELTAHVNYGGGTFATFREFSGVLDGAGHEITDLTLQPGTTADAADANATQTGFVQVLAGGTIKDLTLKRLTSVTAGTTTSRVQQGGVVGRSSGGTVAGVALVDSEVRSADNTDNSSAVGGLVGKTVGTATTTIRDSLLSGTTVSGDKRVGGLSGWQNTDTTVEDNLVVDASVRHHGTSGAGAAFVAGHTVCVGTLTGNVVVSGTLQQASPAGYGWIRSAATGCATSDNLVNANNNIDPTSPVGHTAAPDPNPYDVLWVGTTLLSASGWDRGDLGTYTPAAQLAQQATYEALGWDFDTVWTWDAAAQHPVLQRAAGPVVEPPVITVTGTTASYRVGSSPTAAEVLERLGASVDRGTVALDLSAVDFGTQGSYHATVTAADGDEVAAPVTVTIVVSELDGEGTEASPYVVASVSDLDAAVAMVNADEAQTGAAAGWFELAADLDYAGGTFETFRRFSGVLDGNGHTISDLTLRPGTIADGADAGATQTGFVQVLSGTIRDLTLRDLRSVTAGGTTDRVQQGGFAGRAAGATITGSALMNATVSSANNTDNSSAVGGLVGKSTGAGTTIADNLLAGVSVNGDKRVGGVFGWANVGVDVSRTLVLDTSVTQNGGSGAGGAFVNGHTVCVGALTGNVVLTGSIRQTAAANYGWIATAASGCTATDNLVNANNNIDPTTPVGHTSAPTPNPYDVFWSGSSLLDAGGDAWTRGQLGTYTSRDDLARQATYEGIGWDFTAGTGAWRWDDERRHPVPAGVTFPEVDLELDLAGGTDGDANPATHGYAVGRTLVNPTRTGYVFDGWTGTGIEGASRNVTLPRYPSAPLAYTATWTPVAYAVSYDLAGGTPAGANPASYTVESAAFTLANPTREGYAFAGWTGTGVEQPTATVTVAAGSTGSRSYAAAWTPIGYPLSYDLAGGEAGAGNPASYTVESAAFTLANPTRTGYAFAGWTGTGLTGATTTVVVARGSSQPRSYTATWTPIVYPIIYALGADADFTGPVPGTYTVESDAITLPTPVRPGFVFAGWDGTGLTGPTPVVTIPRRSSGTRTYTPTWDRVHTITYRLAGGALARRNPATFTVRTAPFTLVNPTRPGYDFAGWAGLGATTRTLTIPRGTSADLVLTATWTKKAKARSTVRLKVVRKGARRQAETTVGTVPGYAVPGGTVRVKVTGKVTRKVNGRTTRVRVTRTLRSTLRAGTATVTIPKRLPAGRYRITATYAGDAFYAARTSKARSYTHKK